jgi:hypothetical protein
MLLTTFYSPRGRAEPDLRREFTTQVIREAVPENARQRAAPFEQCSAGIPEGNFVHKSWVTSEGFVHVALISPVVSAKHACDILASLENYSAPVSLTAPVSPAAKQ